MANLFFEELEKKSDGTYEKEIRAMAIDEFAEVLKERNKTLIIGNRMIDEIAEKMKKEG